MYCNECSALILKAMSSAPWDADISKEITYIMAEKGFDSIYIVGQYLLKYGQCTHCMAENIRRLKTR